jgi:polyhydroxybutyrate depolymerase
MKPWLQWLIRIPLILLGLAAVLVLITAIAYMISNHTNGTIISSGDKRSYLLYVPESYDPSTPTPLVISIHGFAQWPAHQMYTTRWDKLADQYGFIVVHPSGTGLPKRWRTSPQAGNETDPLVDVLFISDLIDKLESEYTIDPQRIYVNGLSNGGGMSVLLSCELSERIAAIGTVAGAYTFPWDECNATRPVPAVVFHGTADPIVPYEGGLVDDGRFTFPAIPDWVAGLAQHNGCTAAPAEIPATGSVSGIRYNTCTQDAEVIFYTIAGGGHSWPGGNPLPEFIAGSTTQDIDATQTMWEFFQLHPLPGE